MIDSCIRINLSDTVDTKKNNQHMLYLAIYIQFDTKEQSTHVVLSYLHTISTLVYNLSDDYILIDSLSHVQIYHYMPLHMD